MAPVEDANEAGSAKASPQFRPFRSSMKPTRHGFGHRPGYATHDRPRRLQPWVSVQLR